MQRAAVILFCCFVAAVTVFTPTNYAINSALAQSATQAAPAQGTASAVGNPANACSALADQAANSASQSCAQGQPDSVCYGFDAVKADLADAGQAQFAKAGDRTPLGSVKTLTTSAVDPVSGKLGIAVVDIQAGLPQGSQGITAVLFGDAVITADSTADTPTLPVKAISGTVLLRGGAGPNYASSLKLQPGQDAVVDGRNTAGDWLRVRLASATGWASAPLVTVTGDIKTLPILDDLDTRPGFLYKSPMQSFSLSTKDEDNCDTVSSGLLLQIGQSAPADGGTPSAIMTSEASTASDAQVAHLLINGVDLAISSATVIVRAAPGGRMQVGVVTGSATVSAVGSVNTLNAGDGLSIRLGGKSGLLAAAAPVKAKYSFSLVDSAPSAALPANVPCTVGVPANSNAKVTVRVGPGAERGSLFFMDPAASYLVNGAAQDSKGAPWWKIAADGRAQAWVDQAAVHIFGACDQVSKADIPPVIAAVVIPPTDTSSDTGGSSDVPPTDTGPNFTPLAKSIWNVNPGLDKLVGTCSASVPPINYCPSLVQLTPQGQGLSYKGQELTPYFMVPIRTNVYGYAGPAPEALGPGTIKLTLVFTSPTTWTITRILALSAEGGCQHVYSFTGIFLR